MAGDTKKTPSGCAVVGVGASAGGLDALKQLCASIPADPPFAMVIVQHLDPTQRSQLAEILAGSCEMEVIRAEDGQRLEPGFAYVIPEGVEARVEEGHLELTTHSGHCRNPIDTLFKSLTGHDGAKGCGVLLSGEGTDGTLGLREIRGAGGITLVQDPATAQFDGMSRSAIDSGAADFIGSPAEIAAELLSAVSHPEFGGSQVKSEEELESDDEVLSRILAVVRKESGMDFSAYKRTTVSRRVGRRVMLRDAASLARYLELLEDDATEVEALVDDMLINVTEFFRDPEVFESLRTRVFPEILKDKTDADTLRIWVAGCSTGEEVYSILISALEACEEAGSGCNVTVFGTDASEHAVRRARAGNYPRAVCASVSPERLARYFEPTIDGYEVNRALRDMCVFARQDITKDTPFSRLDVVTLRNVLIYMDQSLQQRVLGVTHFALSPGGFLVLGTSETPDAESRVFKTFDKAHHIYRRKDVTPQLPIDVSASGPLNIGSLAAFGGVNEAPEEYDAVAEANEIALLMYAPPRVVVDERGHVEHFLGDTAPFLEHPEGKATFDVLEMVHPGMALELREALEASTASGGTAAREATFATGDQRRHVSVEVTPLRTLPSHARWLVAFRELPLEASPLISTPSTEDLARLYEAREDRLRRELAELRGRLRVSSEEKERANQGLRIANEESRASNEELRSINEELETAKEELQSANEELTTVNDELRQSNVDLEIAISDLENFMRSTELPVLMLDGDMKVRRFTPQAVRIVHIAQSDEGRPLEHLRFRIHMPDMIAVAQQVLETRAAVDREVIDEDGCWFAVQVRPYVSSRGEVDGVVIVFIDIHELKQNVKRVTRRAELNRALNEIDAAMASTLEFDEIMRRALEEGVRALGVDAGAVAFREGEHWAVQHQVGFPTSDVGAMLSDSQARIAAQVEQTREIVIVPDVHADEGTNTEFAQARGVRAALAAPLITRRIIFGSLLFFSRTGPRAFTRAEQDFSSQLGASLSLAMENARLFEAERESTRRAHTLNAINEIMRSAVTPEELLSRLVGEVSVVAGGEKSLVIEPQGRGLAVTHVRGVSAELVGVERPATFYPAFALAADERRPILISDTFSDSRTNKDFVGAHDLRAFELLPLVVANEVFGVLALAWSTPQTFGADDEISAQRMSVAMSLALSNVLLYQSEVEARERADQELEVTSLLLEASAALASWTNLNDVAQGLAQSLIKATPHTRAIVDIWHEDTQELEVVASEGANPLPVGARWSINDASSAARDALFEKRTSVRDLDEIPADDRGTAVGPYDMHLPLYVPLVQREGLVGLIIIDDPGERRAFERREIELVEGIAAQAAIAIENARLFESKKAELARTTVLKDVTSAAASTLDLGELAQRVLDACRDLLGAKAGSVYVIDHEAGVLKAVALFGFPQKLQESMDRMDLDEERAAARSYLRSEIVMHDSPELPSGIAKRAKAADAAQNRWISLPIRAHGEVLGSLGLIFDEQRTFAADEIALYENLAAQLGAGVEKTRLFESEVDARRQAKAELEYTQVLLDSSAAFAELIEARPMLDRLADVLLSSSAHSRVIIGLWDDERQELTTVISKGEPAVPLITWPLGELSGPGRQMIETRKPVLIDYAEVMEPGLQEVIAQGHLRFALGVPIVARGRLLGTITLDAPGEHKPFSDRAIALVQSVAEQAAVALENAQLFEAEKARRGRIEVLREVSDLAMSSLQPGAGADAALSYVAERLGLAAASLWTVDGSGTRLHPIGGFGFPPAFFEEFADGVALDAPYVVSVAYAQRRMIKHSHAQDEAVPDPVRTAYARHGIDLQSLLVLPLFGRGSAYGAVTLAWDTPHALDDAEVSFCSAVVNALAAGLEITRLFDAEKISREEAESGLRRLGVIHAVTDAMVGSMSASEAAEEFIGKSAELLHADAAVVYLRDERSGVLHPFKWHGVPDDVISQIEIRPERDYNSVLAIRGHKLITVADARAADSPAESQKLIEAIGGLGSYVVAPLFAEGRAVGSFNLGWKQPNGFAEADVPLFESLANELAIAVRNGQLVDSLRQKARLDEALNRIDARIHSRLDFDEIMQSALEDAIDALECDAGALEMRENGGWRVRFQLGFEPEATGLLLSDEQVPNAARAAQLREPLVVDDMATSPANVGFVADHAVRSVLAVPLIVRDEVIGCILIWNRTVPGAFDDLDVDFGRKLAASVSLAVENSELMASEKRELERTRLLQRLATAVAGSLTLDEIGELAIAELKGLPEVAAGAVYVLDEARGALYNFGQFGYPAGLDEWNRELPVDDTTNPGRVAGHGLLQLTHEDPGNPPEAVARLAQMGVPSARWIALPLRSGGKLVGTMGLIFHGERTFEAQELTLFRGIADTLSAAVANARLFEAEQEQLRRVTVLKEVASIGVSAHGVSDMAERVLDLARRLLGAQTGNFFLIDEEADMLRSVANFGIPDEALALYETVSMGSDTASTRVARTGVLLTHEAQDISGTTKRVQQVTGAAESGWLIIPVNVRGNTVGTVGLSFASARPFAEAEIALFQSLADQIGIAFDNARLIEDLDASRAQATGIVESISDGFYALDRDWRFTYANSEAGRLMGVQAQELIGKNIGEALNDPGRLEVQKQSFAPAMFDDKPVTFERYFPQTKIWTELHVYPSADGVVAYGRDITQRKAAEDAVQRQNMALEAINNVLSLALHCESEEELGEACLGEAERLTESAFGFIAEVNNEGILNDISLSDPGWSACSLYDQSGHRRPPSDFVAHGIYGRVVLDEKGFFTNSPGSHPDCIGTPEGHPVLESFIGVPLFSSGRLFGMMALANRPGGYRDEDLKTLELFAPAVVESLLRQRAESTLNLSRERADMLAKLLEEAGQPFGVGGPDGQLLLVNEAFEKLVGYTAQELREISWVTDLTPPEYVEFEEARLVELARTGEPQRYEKEYVRKDGARVPVELLVNVAMTASGEIEYYYSFVTDLTERKQRERLDVGLNKIAASVSATLDRDEVFERLFTGVSDVVRVDACAVASVESGKWLLRHVRGISEDEVSVLLDAGRISGLRSDNEDRFAPMMFEDVACERSVAALGDLGVGQLLVVPLLAGGSVAGVLALAQTDSKTPISEAQVDFATGLMPIATLALENADLYGRERNIAETLQEVILSRLEHVEGLETAYVYRPASSAANVGGDFYDVFRLADGRVGIVTGDVSGKGLDAARFTSLINDGIRAYAHEEPDPGSVLMRLNHLIHLSSPAEAYATVFYAVLDLRSGQLRYCSAGHPSPATVGKEHASYLSQSPAPILGAFEGVEYHSAETILLPGERLVMFTDGVTEARSDGEMFGHERILAALENLRSTPVNRLPQALLGEVLAFSGGHLRDDTVILCVERAHGQPGDEGAD